MKLAIFSVGELFGGVERHILGMATWLLREGHDFILILFYDRELAKQVREIGVEPVILETGDSYDLGAPGRLADILAAQKVDLVHAHGYRAVVNSALARRKFKFALVRTVHGLVEPSRRWSLSWIKSNLYRRLEDWASSHSDTWVCFVTEDLRNRQDIDDRTRTFTVYNGMDPIGRDIFTRPDDLPSGVFNFAAVGRVSPVKDLQTVVLALKQLDSNFQAVLNIIGTGPSIGQLKDLVKDLQLGHRVKFLGFKKDVFEYLAHADALVMPSIHEGLPYTILETMSLKTPIIAARVGGLAEVLEDRRTAILVEPGDVDGWTSAMADLAGNIELADKLGISGRDEQGRLFSLDNMGAGYWRVYMEKLMESGTNG